jgi:hypothetical protein
LKKILDEIIGNPVREEGLTLEEIENSVRSKKTLEGDLENSDFSNQFRAALKFGVAKHRYLKDGKYFKLNKFPPKVTELFL